MMIVVKTCTTSTMEVEEPDKFFLCFSDKALSASQIYGKFYTLHKSFTIHILIARRCKYAVTTG